MARPANLPAWRRRVRATIVAVVNADGRSAIGLRERKKQRTRATLIDAAIELCNRQGYEHTTVDQIAAVADVSPRTFSRYFATKEAVVLAYIDEVEQLISVELARQPAGVSHMEALYRSNVEVLMATTSASSEGLTADRLLASTRILVSSPALMHAASEYPTHAVIGALADRMAVAVDDPRLRLVGALWAAVVMTALAGVRNDAADWHSITIDEIVARIDNAYSQFVELTGAASQPV